MTRREHSLKVQSTGAYKLLQDKRGGREGGVTFGARYKLAGLREGTN